MCEYSFNSKENTSYPSWLGFEGLTPPENLSSFLEENMNNLGRGEVNFTQTTCSF